MKYAFIALIAIYLIIYGCSPDAPDKATDSHKETTAVTAENSHQTDPGAVPEQVEEKAAAPHAEQQQTENATDQVVIVETVEEPAEIVGQVPDEQAAEPQTVVMPCGREMALADIPPDAPCLQGQPEDIQDEAATPDNQQDMAAAMQKMVDVTNDMILVTRDLVIATQEMLRASEKMAVKDQPAEATPPAKE